MNIQHFRSKKEFELFVKITSIILITLAIMQGIGCKPQANCAAYKNSTSITK